MPRMTEQEFLAVIKSRFGGVLRAGAQRGIPCSLGRARSGFGQLVKKEKRDARPF